jgi:putative methionine-R-sulfoxide reductase with GAF domain
MARPYDSLLARVNPTADREAAMQTFVDLLWEVLHPTGVSWLGFYIPRGGELVLGPRRDKPACSPIGLHGVCGQAFRTGRPLVVRDVKELGANYVACDPRDQSEIVIPLLDENRRCWGVFDMDSHDVGAFDEADVEGLSALLRRAWLTT